MFHQACYSEGLTPPPTTTMLNAPGLALLGPPAVAPLCYNEALLKNEGILILSLATCWCLLFVDHTTSDKIFCLSLEGEA